MAEVKKKAGLGEYGVRVDEVHKIIYLTFGGFINDVEGQTQFVAAYEDAKKKVGHTNATLCIDASLLKTFPKEVLDNINPLLMDYSKFLKTYFVEPTSATAKMQMYNILKSLGIVEKYIIVANTTLFPQP